MGPFFITMPEICKIGAIVVVYHPDCERLSRLLDAMRSLMCIVIVKNDQPEVDADFWLLESKKRENLKLLQMESNSGIGRAVNVGAKFLEKNGVDYIWTLDQDSLPSDGCLRHMLVIAEKVIQENAEKIAAIVPVVTDACSGRRLPHLVKKEDGSIGLGAKGDESEVLCAITSGMLIPLMAWKGIGSMNEDFFIDHVDTEWCFRASAKGYKLVISPESVLEHQLGNLEEFNFLGQKIVLRTRDSIRTYHMLRNGWRLAKISHSPTNWGPYFNKEAARIVIKALIFGPNRREQAKAIKQAWMDS